ncbi:MAG TPA: type II secretion system F family protein [Tepidisphaeraceae bacterium]|jgi:type IV pilus assembly protein PilC
MSESSAGIRTFAYRAQTFDGHPISGTIDAPDLSEAQRLLTNLRLRVVEVDQGDKPARPRPLRGDDFIAFNQQLAQLTAAGLPIEHGLRLIAEDTRSGRLAQTIHLVVAELERGVPLGEAFEKHRGNFPPLYGKIVSAGVRTNNLSAMLLNLGRHMDLVARLRGMLWRALSYPIVVLASLMLILIFLGIVIIPQFANLYQGFGVQLPGFTALLLSVSKYFPVLAIILLILIVMGPVVWQILRLIGYDRQAVDRLVLPMPLIGPVMERNLIARWCDAVRLGVFAGLDLPGAIDLAGEAIGSPVLRRDGEKLTAAIASGRKLDQAERTRVLPATVAAAMSLATENRDLPVMLGTLSEMYQQQAESRLSVIPAVLTPMLILVVGLVILMVILGLFLPFLTLIRVLTG